MDEAASGEWGHKKRKILQCIPLKQRFTTLNVRDALVRVAREICFNEGAILF